MKILFAREHITIYPKRSVFLAGPTPPDGNMIGGWRRIVIEQLEQRNLDDTYTVVIPEPPSGEWGSIVAAADSDCSERRNDQIGWELQYLDLCRVTAFWLPVYWTEKSAELFPPNIGPTTRWEFGMMFQQFLDQPSRRLILGGPDDAESVGWARHVARHNDIPWYGLPKGAKEMIVAAEFVDAIVDALA